jgi:hypothetical protein
MYYQELLADDHGNPDQLGAVIYVLVYTVSLKFQVFLSLLRGTPVGPDILQEKRLTVYLDRSNLWQP